MLYVFLGTDIQTIRGKSGSLIDTLKSRRPDASFFRLHADSFSIEQLNTFTDSIGLFSSKYIVLLDNILTGTKEEKTKESDEKAEYLIEMLPQLKSSEHIWIIVEDAGLGLSSGKELTEKQKERLAEIHHTLKKHADKTEVHDVKMSIGSRGQAGAGFGDNLVTKAKVGMVGSQSINSFAFTDALCSKNKKAAVFALDTLRRNGVAAEEVHGALWWQVKVLLQVLRKSTKGVSPFVIRKSQDALRLFSEKEIYCLADTVVDMYHKAHAGECDLYNEMERVVMRVGLR
jgi:DNA polymerase III delta subunit